MGPETELEEHSQDDFPDGGLFDPDQTLPYMWGNDPDTTLPSVFEEDPQPFDPPENLFLSGTNSSSQTLAGDSDMDSQGNFDPFPLTEPRTTRADRKSRYQPVTEIKGVCFINKFDVRQCNNPC